MLQVQNHKTTATYGSLDVVVDSVLNAWMVEYIDVRGRVPQLECHTKEIFITWGGAPITQSHVGTILTTMSGRVKQRTTCTAIRKMGATMACYCFPYL